MASFLSRVANEASIALSDAYGHVMHGDDAGSSARLVWVVHPTKVPIDSDGDDGKKYLRGDHAAAVGSPSNRSDNIQFFYTQKFDLGLTFIEINNRAYVRTVDDGSPACLAGIQPQDCVQFACVVGGPRFEDVELRNSLAIGGGATSPRGSRRSRLEEQEYEDEKQRLDSKATAFSIECEKRGIRTSYSQLRDLFAGCILQPKGERNGIITDPLTTPERKPNILPVTPKSGRKNNARTYDDDCTIDDTNSFLDSIGGMFEMRQSRGTISSRCVPLLPDATAKSVTLSVTNAARNMAGSCFIGTSDDDNSRMGERKNDNESLLIDLPSSPIKSGAVTSPTSPRSRSLSGGGFEQQLYPVVIVFRRTVQRKRNNSPDKSGGSYGSSLRGSLFGIPSFRMDDECDRAAALVRELAPVRPESSVEVIGEDDVRGHGASMAAGPEYSGGIEAATIRGMIQKALGLGFVRTSKVVVGFSVQAGSGIVIARLPDGTWSAPSAIGVCGLGVGLQFGLELADFMFILQTKESVEHFQRGGNFAVGGNIGAAVASVGREAYGAASLGSCASPSLESIQQSDSEDEEEDTHYEDSTHRSNASSIVRKRKKHKTKDGDVAPMVAYAKSQGLYFGVSVEGLKFFTRNDINHRTYKFSMLSELTAKDILNGLVSPPTEAEELYAALHSVELAHDVTELPKPPAFLRKDAMNDWLYKRSITVVDGEICDSSDTTLRAHPPFSFFSSLTKEEAAECSSFETKFKKFLYGGVTVQRLVPNAVPTRNGMTRREKRTLWLMLPEVGSLRLGFVSKTNDGGSDDVTMDDMTLASSVATSVIDMGEHPDIIDNKKVRLSNKHSMSLTDITLLSQEPQVSIRLSPDEPTEHFRIISIQDCTSKSLLFLANDKREAELLVCGLKLLLECESARLCVRGGVQLNRLGGKVGKGALSPSAARGSIKLRDSLRDEHNHSRTRNLSQQLVDTDDRSKYSSIGEPGSSSDSSDNGGERGSMSLDNVIADTSPRHQVAEGRHSWSQVPSRNHMRDMAESTFNSKEFPTYMLGKEIRSHIAANVYIPLPLPFCRVLFLDCNSPVIRSWGKARGDSEFRWSEWSFGPGSPRQSENSTSSEQQLISSGSMAGAQRAVSFKRVRNNELISLSEVIVVGNDDCRSLSFEIVDRMPRRGFSAKARISVRSCDAKSCEASVVAELVPVGKNLSNQLAVHKAFILVLDEMKARYGDEDKGLLAFILNSHNTSSGSPQKRQPPTTSSNQQHPATPTKTNTASLTSFKDVLQGGNVLVAGNEMDNNPTKVSPQKLSQRRARQGNVQERPSTPSIRQIETRPSKIANKLHRDTKNIPTDNFADFSQLDVVPKKPTLVEVKPLPKIRLDLCPVPREEDEEEGSGSAGGGKQKKKSKHSKHKHRRSSNHKH